MFQSNNIQYTFKQCTEAFFFKHKHTHARTHARTQARTHVRVVSSLLEQLVQ